MSTVIPIGMFYQVHRGGGLHSVMLNQRLGAVFAHVAARIGLHPAHVTLAAFTLGVSAGAILCIIAPVLPDLSDPERVTAAAVAWCAFQCAYSLDCADGQLARVTGRASAAGGTLDLMCDVIVQTVLVTGLASTAAAFSGPVPPWAVAAWGAAWIATLVTSQAAKNGGDVSLIGSQHLLIQVLKLSRDYGCQLSVSFALLAMWPAGLQWFLWAVAAVNGLVVAGLIVRSARCSITSGSERQGAQLLANVDQASPTGSASAAFAEWDARP